MVTQTELGRALSEARQRTDGLFGLVRPDSLYERTIPERHRIIFYLGHVEAFDWNLLARYALDRPSFHPSFDRLFAFGIDPPPGQLPSDEPRDWPRAAEVELYNQRTRDEIDRLLDALPEQLLHVAIEHRLMHAETLAYILHQLPYERKTPQAIGAPPAGSQPWPEMVEIPAGAARLGRDPEEGFGWDNEFRAHDVDVPAFAIGKYKVTNREYLDFVRAGAMAPLYWAERSGRWFYRGMFSEFPLPLDCPVYVTLREAQAYTLWRGMRLPSEAEFHRAAARSGPAENVDFERWDPIPVNAGGDGADGPAQMVGNGWEWTSTVFEPLPGFDPFPFYPNYSAPFFDGEHYVLKGGSPRTAARFLRPSFRNWFRASYPYIYSTFRLVEA
jgi:gamma-glutamyl hercynylcysteine S-oxide synthase